MIRALLIHSYLFAAIWHGILDSLPTTPLNDCRSWAYNHSSQITSCPDSLWNRLDTSVQDSIIAAHAERYAE